MDDFVKEHYNTLKIIGIAAIAVLIPALAVWIEVKLGMKPGQKPTFKQVVVIVGALVAWIALLGVMFG